jgi:hypothetical protein
MEYLDKKFLMIDIQKVIEELENWHLPELDEKQAKKLAKKLKKIKEKIDQY